MKIKASMLITVLTLLMSSTASALPQAHAIPGGIAIIQLSKKEAAQAPWYYQQHQVMLTQQHQDNTWRALVGMPLSTKKTQHFIYTKDKRHRISFKSTTDFHYPIERFTVKKKFLNLSKKDLARHQRERQLAKQHYALFSQTDVPVTSMQLPIVISEEKKDIFSSLFGTQRFINGQPRSPHSGLDIRATLGTTILAPANGTVTLVSDFFFNGKVLFIDHGHGLISMMCHMNEISVQVGDAVQAGMPVGQVGNTGRTTGPHLHWSLSMNAVRINPMLFLSQKYRSTHPSKSAK